MNFATEHIDKASARPTTSFAHDSRISNRDYTFAMSDSGLCCDNRKIIILIHFASYPGIFAIPNVTRVVAFVECIDFVFCHRERRSSDLYFILCFHSFINHKSYVKKYAKNSSRESADASVYSEPCRHMN